MSFALPGHAEQLYRCVGQQGSVSYQSRPCAAGQRLDRVLEFQPEAAQPAPSRAIPRRAPAYGQAHGTRLRGTHPRRMLAASDRCRIEKNRREAALQRLGLTRTFAQLSHLDEPVRAACRGF
ncbi:DUF4124 domain-containing protein [Thermomonas paludicola]|uniref:DUF4124 domain-containing protein n=1 Tax=Thermomonas paludicola TaxID=2884874 RepID=UPI0021151164|nr:DUF4124 domain-containing protein [Thermomonas paludicola]